MARLSRGIASAKIDVFVLRKSEMNYIQSNTLISSPKGNIRPPEGKKIKSSKYFDEFSFKRVLTDTSVFRG